MKHLSPASDVWTRAGAQLETRERGNDLYQLAQVSQNHAEFASAHEIATSPEVRPLALSAGTAWKEPVS